MAQLHLDKMDRWQCRLLLFFLLLSVTLLHHVYALPQSSRIVVVSEMPDVMPSLSNVTILIQEREQSNRTVRIKARQNITHLEDGRRRFFPNPFYQFTPGYKSEILRLSFANAFVQNDTSLFDGVEPYQRHWKMKNLLNVYNIELRRAAPKQFAMLRSASDVNETAYQEEVAAPWQPSKNVGLSGSLFFSSAHDGYLIKSLQRRFEYRFLHRHFMTAYLDYVTRNPDTLLNKVYDVLYSFDRRLGDALGVSPSHYLVLENIKHGLPEGSVIFDVKPSNYTEPQRDFVPKCFQKEGVTDVIDRTKLPQVSISQKVKMMAQLANDLKFLAEHDIVDYSLLIVANKKENLLMVRVIDFLWSNAFGSRKYRKMIGKAFYFPEFTVTADAHGYLSSVLWMVDQLITVTNPRSGFKSRKSKY